MTKIAITGHASGIGITGGHKEHAGKWLIEQVKDATMFALKWKTK